MIWLGGLIVVLTFVAIIKKFETRMVLFTSGLLMAILSGKPSEAITAFQAAMVNNGLVPVICTVMGFAFVMRVTKCDSHLVHLLAGPLTKFRMILIPGAVLVTWTINIALTSAAGCAAAVGAILIPALIAAGVHPAMAASAIMAGTWGSVISPGNSHNAFISKMANVDVMSVIAVHSSTSLAAVVVVAIGLTIIAIVFKENHGYQSDISITNDENFKVNILKAIIPVVPLVLLVLGSKQLAILPPVTVPQSMIFGVILAFVVTWVNPQEITKQFFNGMGDAYGNVIGIIIAAAVFTKGMQLIGLTGALIDSMKQSESIAKVAATFGPFIVAVLSGSGDAAALAFNGAITPHAQQFGYGMIEMGSVAQVAGALGRSMSPVAGAAIICAQLAKVGPFEITKRNGIVMFIAAIVMMMGMM